MFERITFNLDFTYHCEKLRLLDSKHLISFVIPTKNEAGYLPRLLTSINYIAQVCKIPIETIVVDYMSIDGTPDIAKKMGSKVIEADKPGVGYASYVGVLSAKGDIVIRTDADVIMTPSAVYETIKIFTNSSKKLIATVGHIYYPFDLTTNLMAYLYDRYVRKPYNTTGYFIAFKKEITEKLNFNPHLKANDDWDFGFRALKLLGLNRLHYNYHVAVLVSSRLIKKKNYSRYLLENLGIIKTIPKPYSQL
jgi:glycosyltransferase involved in cell wall biosynthesis